MEVFVFYWTTYKYHFALKGQLLDHSQIIDMHSLIIFCLWDLTHKLLICDLSVTIEDGNIDTILKHIVNKLELKIVDGAV